MSHISKENRYELKLLQDDTESNSDEEEPMISASSKDNFTPSGSFMTYSGIKSPPSQEKQQVDNRVTMDQIESSMPKTLFSLNNEHQQ